MLAKYACYDLPPNPRRTPCLLIPTTAYDTSTGTHSSPNSHRDRRTLSSYARDTHPYLDGEPIDVAATHVRSLRRINQSPRPPGR